MKIKRKTRKLIKELKKMESGIFKFSDGKAIYYSLDEYLDSLYKEIARLNKIIDELEKWLEDTYNHFMYDNCEEILHNKPEEMEKYGFMYNLSSIYDKANIIEIIRKKN